MSPVEGRIAALREAGQVLADRPAREILGVLAEATARWADPDSPERRAGESALAGHLGVPEAAVAPILDAAFPRWDEPTLRRWVEGEIGSLDALDGFAPLGSAHRRAVGPRLTVFIGARGVPTTPVADLLSALLVKSAVWLKPASGSDDLAARFARTLSMVNEEVGAAVEVAGWEVGSSAADRVPAAADLLVATGGADTMAAFRRSCPDGARTILHGPRISVAILLRESLQGGREETVAALADDTAFAGQAGCLSPVVAWVEAPAEALPDLASDVAAACAVRWPGPARERTPPAERAAWAEWVATAELEAASGPPGGVSGGATDAWSVRALGRPGPPDPPPVPRALTLMAMHEAAEAAALCRAREGQVATVGVAGPKARRDALAPGLAAAGVERICPLGRMQRPPVDWRRDGRATLTDMVRWVDREE